MLDLLDDLGAPAGVATVHQHGGTVLGEFESGGPADARCRSRDQRSQTRQLAYGGGCLGCGHEIHLQTHCLDVFV
jgi:hypothetical protein